MAIALDTEHHLQIKSECLPRIQPTLMCPDSILLPKVLQMCLVLTLVYCTAFFLLGKTAAPPSGSLFQFITLIAVALTFGKAFEFVDIPPLIGMLLAGILLKEVGFINFGSEYKEAILSLRKISITVILIKAGLYLNPEVMKRLSWIVLRLAFAPCCVEAVTCMAVAYLILDLPLLWGLLMGFVIGAVSPAILVPSLLKLEKEGYGSKSGIHTLGIAASGIDDILAITMFGIILGLIFDAGTFLSDIIKGPVGVLAGVIIGVLYGLILIYVPHKSEKNVVFYRVFLQLAGGIVCIFGSHAIGFDGAGPLACMVSTFVATCGWSAAGQDPAALKSVTTTFSGIWYIFEPVLFSVIGTEIHLSRLSGRIVLQCLAVLLLALMIRLLVAFLVTAGGVFERRERFFLAIAWMPKASVQGLLGPIALEMATKQNDDQAGMRGNIASS
ncbi:sodium/hydrogen exchanger 9B2-like [Cloeon dipterum]|uniref:sodium/hydrogen exchanger 9B2-like n=1 Tax=Cloeon dipterum TaxID=197152 RepID=UPI0032204A8A